MSRLSALDHIYSSMLLGRQLFEKSTECARRDWHPWHTFTSTLGMPKSKIDVAFSLLSFPSSAPSPIPATIFYPSYILITLGAHVNPPTMHSSSVLLRCSKSKENPRSTSL